MRASSVVLSNLVFWRVSSWPGSMQVVCKGSYCGCYEVAVRHADIDGLQECQLLYLREISDAGLEMSRLRRILRVFRFTHCHQALRSSNLSSSPGEVLEAGECG